MNDKDRIERAIADEIARKTARPPVLSDSEVSSLVLSLFGRRVVRIKALDSYDDRNYYIECEPTEMDKKHTTSASSSLQPFVFKLHNSVDTLNSPFIDAQIAVLQHLRAQGLSVQEPIATLSGEYVVDRTFVPPAEAAAAAAEEAEAEVTVGSNSASGSASTCDASCTQVTIAAATTPSTHSIRMLRFLQGKLMSDFSDQTPQLLSSLGAFAAAMDRGLLSFSHVEYPGVVRGALWDLQNLPSMKQFVQHIKGEERQKLILDVSGFIVEKRFI